MDELIPVNILIGDRTYRLRIDAEDEEMLRKMVKLINDKIIEFKTSFAGKDMQDFVAMVLIWFATEQNKFGNEKIYIKDTTEKLSALEKMIDAALEVRI
ncbi:MAG TPA: cell division protein ZapA [Panacibacter sp.]|nr:cell division protein ZapA [Panacibacter sp.]